MGSSIERVRKVLELERRLGYRDTAVFGGLEGFIARFAEPLHEQIQGYGGQSPEQRQATLQALEEALERWETEADAGRSSEGARATPSQGEGSEPDEDVLEQPVRFAKGVGAQRARLLKKLGIETIGDLLLYLPRRLEDRSVIKKIGELRHGDRATVQGRVRAVDVIKPRPNLEIVKAAVQDNTGVLFATWFNQSWLKAQLGKLQGERIALYGQTERLYGGTQMANPVWEPAGERFLTGRLVPIYPVTQGLTPATLSRLIRENLSIYGNQIPEVLPEEVRERRGLLSKSRALEKIHFPETLEDFERARKTLAFEELFLFQIGVALERRSIHRQRAPILTLPDEALEEFLEALPFKLTNAQRRALDEIRRDLASGHPMNRLLQGDVGSGKTAVAAGAAFIAIRAGTQAALMAPTEILAQQHYTRLRELLEPLGVRVTLLVGSLSSAEKEEARRAIEAGLSDLVVGTHALITEDVEFQRLGLAVIDEQHRFGVIQRAALEEKGEHVHVLVMSATPIPRTITLTLYGQFEISIIDELPFPKDVRTYWVSEEVREEVYKLVAQEAAKGAQVYVVYPLIEESEELELRAAAQMKEELERTFFRDLRVGLLHGRMGDEEKQRVMEKLQQKALDVLVSTSIIEVGIDVPDASLMIIEHAERFGLSQLHQLRGRIGRQGQRAWCFAVATAKTEEARRRLEAFRDLADGFEIAEVDLLIRGPGELLGLAQHGLDTTFKVADLIRDLPLMKAAREEAFRLVEGDPSTPLIEEFHRRFGGEFELARV
jgi:ATP-dependent DNA helicase RecG